MWTSRLFWKVFLVYVGLSLATAVIFLVAIFGFYETQLLDNVDTSLLDTAVLLRGEVADRYETDRLQPEQLQALFEQFEAESRANVRLTLIRSDGKVLADSHSHPAQVDNHRSRPEVAEALSGTVGKSVRFSDTIKRPMHYVALPVKHDGEVVAVVRVAMDVATINERSRRMRLALWSIAAVLGLVAAGLTFLIVRRIIRPLEEINKAAQAMADGNYDVPVPRGGSDEIGSLGESFARTRAELAKRIFELHQQNERLGTVLGSMVEGVIAVDADYRIILANRASRVMMKLSTPDVVGRPLQEAIRSRPLLDAVQETFRSQGVFKGEFEVIDELRRALMVRAARLPGEPCPGVVVVLHDVTELRKLENLRREFVANVSHELKTPLASIKAYAETLRLGALNDPENNLGFVERIEEQAERLDELIQDMLHIARMESGEEAFDLVDVSLDRVVEDAYKLFSEAAKQKQIDLKIQPASTPLEVQADEEGLRAIIGNLVDNAIKYTSAGGTVTVSWQNEGEQVRLTVSDTGIGIPRDARERIFERFYRVDRARSREMGGTGLGLSIVKHLTQAFGGSVSVQSEVDQGTTFEVRLPLV